MTNLVSLNPSKNYTPIGEVEISSIEEIKAKVQAAHQAKQKWKEIGVSERVKILKSVYDAFDAKKEELALLMTKEMGKSIRESRQETKEFFLDEFKWFLDNAESSLADETVYSEGQVSNRIVYEPYGISAVILPWNFPLEMFVWGCIPNLLAGNVVVLKCSEECPLIGKEIEKIMSQSLLPKGVFSEIYGDGSVGEALVNEDIDFLWFTGSSKVGKHLYSLVGQKPKFIKSLMELGGSSPGIVFEDANIDVVLDKICTKRLLNAGQACSALKRLIVHKSIFNEVVEKISNKFREIKVGDPEDKNTDMGCLVAKRQLDLLTAQVNDAIEKGAEVKCGGKSPENLQGAFYLPTVLTNIDKDMRVWTEEVFGPVLPIISFETEEEAAELANDTKYGLTGYVFTEDKNRFERVASKIQAGQICLNNIGTMSNDSPFGGYKMSGIGRELGKVGFQELCQIKVVCS